MRLTNKTYWITTILFALTPLVIYFFVRGAFDIETAGYMLLGIEPIVSGILFIIWLYLTFKRLPTGIWDNKFLVYAVIALLLIIVSYFAFSFWYASQLRGSNSYESGLIGN